MTSPYDHPQVPWRLLAAGAFVMLGLPTLYSSTRGLGPKYSGRAVLSRPLSSPGWQAVIDPGALSKSERDRLIALLEGRWGANDPAFDPSAVSGLQLAAGDGGSRPTVSAVTLPTDLPADPLFTGGPLLEAEVVEDGRSFGIKLYRHPQWSGLFSGRIQGRWPALGAALVGSGFTLDQMGPFPPSVERLLSVDASLLALAEPYKEKLQLQWRRWEFVDLAQLRDAFGPCLTYLRWGGRSYFSLAMTQPEEVRRTLAKRFPASVVPTAVSRVQGTRLQGFDPAGPAWALRGDHLWASREGGTAALGEFVQQAVAGAPSVSPVWEELVRLASTEPGWHLVALASVPEWGLTWGAVLRWPKPGEETFEGYLVLAWRPSSKRGTGEPVHHLTGHQTQQ